MICPLCGKEHDDPYILKLKKIVDKEGNKEEIIKARICLNCEYHLFVNLRKSAKQGRNEELRAKSEKSDRVESMCCDCIQPDHHSICGDYSENEWCKHRKEDGSCWK